jgi:hypothetical protein
VSFSKTGDATKTGLLGMSLVPHRDYGLYQSSDITDISMAPGSFMVKVPAGARYIIFNDAYDDRWRATAGGADLQHFTANGFSNGYLVPVSQRDTIVSLRFGPQRFLMAGYCISALLFVTGVTSLAFLLIGARTPFLRSERGKLQEPL